MQECPHDTVAGILLTNSYVSKVIPAAGLAIGIRVSPLKSDTLFVFSLKPQNKPFVQILLARSANGRAELQSHFVDVGWVKAESFVEYNPVVSFIIGGVSHPVSVSEYDGILSYSFKFKLVQRRRNINVGVDTTDLLAILIIV
jgi:hypothetical protein